MDGEGGEWSRVAGSGGEVDRFSLVVVEDRFAIMNRVFSSSQMREKRERKYYTYYRVFL